MANEQVMYSLNPILDSSQAVELPDCMYRLKSYHDNAQGDTVDPVILELEKRQASIIARLEQLKNQVDELTQNQAGDAKTVPSSGAVWSINGTLQCSDSVVAGDTIRDIVINANPANPPYSLFILQQMLAKQYKVLSSSYAHSSALDVSDKLRNIYATNGIAGNRNQHQFAFTLIWKDVSPSPSLMVQPQKQTLIQGEAAVARYLARLLQPSYENGSIIIATEIDSMLDLASQLLRGNKSEKAAVMKALNGRLGRSQWLVGNSLSLADIVVWSAIQQSGQTATAPSNVSKWLKLCGQQTEFSRITDML
jgi:aminoacyl tRNA synthase complex-interacting multifunctional protein 2